MSVLGRFVILLSAGSFDGLLVLSMGRSFVRLSFVFFFGGSFIPHTGCTVSCRLAFGGYVCLFVGRTANLGPRRRKLCLTYGSRIMTYQCAK